MSDKSSETEHAQQVHNENAAAARRAHDIETEHGFRLNEAAINNANLFLRALLIINGAAALGLLAFFSNTGSAMPGEAAPLISFAGGVAATTVAMGLAYLTNYCYTSASVDRHRGYEQPYVRESRESEKWIKIGSCSHKLAVVLAISAVAFFICGVFGAHSIIRPS